MKMNAVRRISLAFVATIAAASAVRAEEPFSWSGLYVGGHVGGGLSKSDVADPYGSAIYGDTISSPGPLAGGQIGYNYQSGAMVLGIEAAASWADLNGANTCLQVSPNTFFGATCGSDTKWLGALTGRLGVALGADGRGLLYGKGGLAWDNGEFIGIVNNSSAGDTGPNTVSSKGSLTRWGWTLGVGAEYALDGNWSTRIEYDYMNFGSQDVATPNAAFGPNAPDGRLAGVDQDLHAVKLGLNYRFGDRAAPASSTGSIRDVIEPSGCR
jgi:opacity protein-like surface antigen